MNTLNSILLACLLSPLFVSAETISSNQKEYDSTTIVTSSHAQGAPKKVVPQQSPQAVAVPIVVPVQSHSSGSSTTTTNQRR